MTPELATIVLTALVAGIVTVKSPSENRMRLFVTDAVMTSLFLVAATVVMALGAFPSSWRLLTGAWVVSRVVLIGLAVRNGHDWLTPARAGIVTGLFCAALIPAQLEAVSTDGDESYYVLIAESMLHDGDVDLTNQYANPELSVIGRTDLGPQLGDPVGPSGELYSRHGPLLPLFILPGVSIAGVGGAVATISIFAGLLAWAWFRLGAEAGIATVALQRCWIFLSFAPPVLFYSTRIWPEVPATFCFVQSLRAANRRQWAGLFGWGLLTALFKLRFLPVVVALILLTLWRDRDRIRGLATRVRWSLIGGVVLVVTVPMLVMTVVQGSALGIHTLSEIVPGGPLNYLRGSTGLLVDAQAGLLFQSPFMFLGLVCVFAAVSPPIVRLGLLALVPYIVLLVPRAEWHGGWSPPLRYVVIFAPLLVLGVARLFEAIPRWISLIAAVASAGLVVHGIAFPGRLFHIANGESVLGEWLSVTWGSDFSRILPSLIRPNAAAIVWTVLAIVFLAAFGLLLRRGGSIDPRIVISGLAIALACGVFVGASPGRVVQLEDAHVIHEGGELYPPLWTVARFRFDGGWTLRPGDRARFRLRGDEAVLRYQSEGSAVIRVNGAPFRLRPTPRSGWLRAQLPIARSGGSAVEIEVLSGEVTADWIAGD